jgi:hypothetical protein
VISTDGAALIATLLPIAVLLLSFEAKSLLRLTRPAKKWARWVFCLVLVLVLGAGLAAVNLCVGSVAADEALRGSEAVLVGWIASVIGALTGFAVGGVIAVYVFSDLND